MNSKASGSDNGDSPTTLSVAAEPSEFAGVRMRVAEFSTNCGLSHDTGHQITLILEELFANLLNHGGGRERAVGAEIMLRRDGATVHIRFGDNGAPFNPLDAPPPGLEGGAESRAVGGLGVHLMRQLTTAAAYRRADGRNILDMEMTVPARRD